MTIRHAIANALRDPLNKGWAIFASRNRRSHPSGRALLRVSAASPFRSTIAGALRDPRGLFIVGLIVALAIFSAGAIG